MTCWWWISVKSQIYPKRHAFFFQFLLIFCSCCGAALCWLALVDDTAQLWTCFFFVTPSSSIRLICVSPQWSAETVWSLAGDPSSPRRPRSPGSGVHAAFAVFLPEPAIAAHLSISAWIHAEDVLAIPFLPLFPVWLLTAWVLVARSSVRLLRIWQLHWRLKAQPERTDRQQRGWSRYCMRAK